jgi:hypothetical protein
MFYETQFFGSISLYPTITEKENKNSNEILNCGLITYTVNTVKIEYPSLAKPTAANILTLLVWC